MNADLVAAHEKARRQAETDELTGLRNRRAITDALDKAGAHSTVGTPTAVLLIDIDHFKQVNDTRGHATGDAVLRTVAGVLDAGVRSGGTVGRYGGEEFLVVLPRVGEDEALRLAEELQRDVAAASTPVDAESSPIGVTISGGVAFWRDGDTYETVVARADVALYAAKGAGRNCVSDERQQGAGERSS